MANLKRSHIYMSEMLCPVTSYDNQEHKQQLIAFRKIYTLIRDLTQDPNRPTMPVIWQQTTGPTHMVPLFYLQNFVAVVVFYYTGLQNKIPGIKFQYSVNVSFAEYEHESHFFPTLPDFPNFFDKI